MTFHLAAWYESIDPAGSWEPIAAVSDDRLYTEGDSIRVPSNLTRVLWANAVTDTASLVGARLISPSLDRYAPLNIAPINADNDGEVNNPGTGMFMTANPPALAPTELVKAEVNTDPSAAGEHFVVMALGDAPPSPIRGAQTFTWRATASATLTKGAWTRTEITPDSNLPAGTYGIVGMYAQSATLVAARVILRTGQQWRPGCWGTATYNAIENPVQRNGGMGLWGTFDSVDLPAVEFLSGAADTAQHVIFDLIAM